MSKRPRAEEHANGGGGGRQEQQHHRGGGGGGYGRGGGRGGRGGGGGKMPHLSAAAEEKRQGMRVQEMETLRKRVVEEAPAPGMSTSRRPKILCLFPPSHSPPHTPALLQTQALNPSSTLGGNARPSNRCLSPKSRSRAWDKTALRR